MRTRGSEALERIQVTGPRSRTSIHAYKMDQDMKHIRQSPRLHKHIRYANTEELPMEDALSDSSDEEVESDKCDRFNLKDNSHSYTPESTYGYEQEYKRSGGWNKTQQKDTESYENFSNKQKTQQERGDKHDRSFNRKDRSYSYTSESSYGRNRAQQETQQERGDITQTIGYKTLFFIIIIIAVSLVYWVSNLEDEKKPLPPLNFTHTESLHEQKLRSDLRHIRDEFPSQFKDIWIDFSAGIKKVQEKPPQPSVFLLLHETEDETSDCLARKVGKVATQFLNATHQHPLILEGTALEHDKGFADDYGMLIDENRRKIEERRSLIVYNLHKIPAKIAQSFHSICDTVTPLVDKAVIFFTMKTERPNLSSKNPTELAEIELKKLWDGHLNEDTLQPLIVRITDMVMFIKPERNLTSCHI